jgi:hypothetical protein
MSKSQDDERQNSGGGFIIAVVSLLCIAINAWFIYQIIKWIAKRTSKKTHTKTNSRR